MKALANFLGERFPRIKQIIESEEKNQIEVLNLIGSANKPFQSVLDSRVLPFHSNPGEGFPGSRYFPGCDNLDEIEIYSEELAKALFKDSQGYWFTTQPYSGTQANQIVYNSILKPGDTILCLDLASGGHVSHWSFTNRYFDVEHYNVKDGCIDYKELKIIAEQIKPNLIIAGASSYPREIDYALLGNIAEQTNSLLLADLSHTAAYVISGLHISPFPYAHFVTMTTHKTTRGVRGGMMFVAQAFEKQTKRSIFPISQGAPMFVEIIGKAIMLEELNNMDVKEYAGKAIKFAQIVATKLKGAGFNLYTGGTDTHLVVVDLSESELSGKEAEESLQRNNILANRNLIPNDPRPASITSGLRIGVLMMVTLGFSERHVHDIASIILRSLQGECGLAGDTKEILKSYS